MIIERQKKSRRHRFTALALLALLNAGAVEIVNAQTEFIWSGAVTPTTARVNARIDSEGAVVRIAFSEQADLSAPLFSGPDTAITAENNRVITGEISGLQPNTRYYYAPEINGAIDISGSGTFRTHPQGRALFKLALASCSWTGSANPVFNSIKNQNPLFFMHLGDMHYENIPHNNRDLFRNAFNRALTSPTQSALYRSTAVDYVWDDHDYGPNNSDSTSPAREAARLTYREYAPHYPLVEGDDTAAAIYHSFDVGRVRFIICDARSARSPASAPDNSAKTMLGETQKDWFKAELLRTKRDNMLAVWANSLPWIGLTGDDGWYLYTTERRELANFIAEKEITELCMISGDAHMIAIDDGSNSDYSDSGEAGFPVFHAAPLDRRPSAKGGPYSHGVYLASSGQYGTMTVSDDGENIGVLWQGWRMNEEVVRYEFSFNLPDCDGAYTCGDLNSDSQIDSQDVAFLIEYYFNHGPAPCPLESGDVTCDGTVDLSDILTLIWSIENPTTNLCCFPTPNNPKGHAQQFIHDKRR
jgi:alkaline phosphatase D